ncbi:MAG: DEAD/DEAH box helicase family protein [Clostridiales bacterium]|nr:DEAD/DEAH box helicase family protein [Clostridiales bacterium]
MNISEICGVKFSDATLLSQIFTHSSYGKQHGVPHNETLATLGDAALKFAFSLTLHEKYPSISKGDLTECKKLLEGDNVFADLEIIKHLFPYLKKIADKTKDEKGLTEMRAGLYEAIGYGIFMNGGIAAVKDFVLRFQKENFVNGEAKYKELTKPKEAIITAKILESNVNMLSAEDEKIALFMSLFRGRSDVYARRWESKAGKSGYSPVCANEWGSGCGKPKVKCADCKSREYPPLDKAVIKSHLQGKNTVGVYPMTESEDCYFLAVDFDGADYKKDIAVFREACELLELTPSIERSRSGEGGHVWFFFEDKISARLARKFGVKLLTYAMSLRHEIDFKSYDRLFPNQDTMPKGGFGNLIALPLQAVPRKSGNSVFTDENFVPYDDQWAYLSSVKKLDFDVVNRTIDAIPDDEAGIEDAEKPWEVRKEVKLSDADYPEGTNIVLADMIYIEKLGMSERLLHKLKRLAAFKNPEFFKAQAMRLNTYGKPRIISCADESKEYIHLPRGLLDEVKRLLAPCKVIIDDKRNNGKAIDVEFVGTLRENQNQAVQELLKYDNGVLSATTAFGKTVAGINIIAQRKTNTLILVHRAQLASQWKERLEQFLKINTATEEVSDGALKRKRAKRVSVIGQYGAQKNKLSGMIDIALLQSVAGKGTGSEVKDFVKNYGMVVVDECHHVSAFSFEQVMKAVNAKYVYGLTATPKRQDGHDPIITMQCGAIRYAADNKSEIRNRTFEHYVIPRFTRFSCEDDTAITKIYSELSQNSFRNEMIVKDAAAAFKNGRTSIILCNRKDHVKTLAESLEPHCKNIIILVGGGKAKEKREELERLKALPQDEPFIIVATGKYVGEGFDEPRLDTLFLADPISWRGTLEQYVGRLHRNYEGKKEVIVYDYADIRSKVLEKMYQSRVKGYAALGYLTKAATESEGNIIFDEYGFADAFYNDIAGAAKRIVVSSPYLREKSVKAFIRNIEILQDIGVTVFTREPDEKNVVKANRVIKLLKDAGAKATILPKLYQKFAVIDNSVVWYGGINPLGVGYSDESIMRIPSREIAAELMATVEQ